MNKETLLTLIHIYFLMTDDQILNASSHLDVIHVKRKRVTDRTFLLHLRVCKIVFFSFYIQKIIELSLNIFLIIYTYIESFPLTKSYRTKILFILYCVEKPKRSGVKNAYEIV